MRIFIFMSSPTWQGALTLRQVEDFMKSSSLGAVVPSAVLLPADGRSWSADTPPTPRCRKLWGWTGRNRGFTNQSEAPGSPLQVKQPFYISVRAIRHHFIVLWLSQCDENVALPNSCLRFWEEHTDTISGKAEEETKTLLDCCQSWDVDWQSDQWGNLSFNRLTADVYSSNYITHYCPLRCGY